MVHLYSTATHREQINELTAYIDASMVYGSSQGELDVLRESQPNDRKFYWHVWYFITVLKYRVLSMSIVMRGQEFRYLNA
jgi:hypothetical protein